MTALTLLTFTAPGDATATLEPSISLLSDAPGAQADVFGTPRAWRPARVHACVGRTHALTRLDPRKTVRVFGEAAHARIGGV
ncbi:hypothetical protein B0H17DRAFT_1197206 [Mycena rosella]|uniref:Uncharacterized protein n=1 Tax=Mycena rosella TaxID=1033263 RepID=A0AAD7DSA2_MYCRO|nr:hypothetical protein B0H17DRAFT_1197206 [Mycena rosella]